MFTSIEPVVPNTAVCQLHATQYNAITPTVSSTLLAGYSKPVMWDNLTPYSDSACSPVAVACRGTHGGVGRESDREGRD